MTSARTAALCLELKPISDPRKGGEEHVQLPPDVVPLASGKPSHSLNLGHVAKHRTWTPLTSDVYLWRQLANTIRPNGRRSQRCWATAKRSNPTAQRTGESRALATVGPNDLGASLNQTTELARVKARIKALAEKTVANGCTEAEALSAAEMVGRLLEQYSLSMDEIEVRTSRCVQVEVPLGGRRR